MKKSEKLNDIAEDTMNDEFELIMAWWGEMDVFKQECVHRQKLERFFKEKGIIAGEKEVDGLLRIVVGANLKPNGLVQKSHYLKIMAKPIMKGALMNVYKYTMSTNILNLDLPLSLKILKFQRKILLAGVKGQIDKYHKNAPEAGCLTLLKELQSCKEKESLIELKKRIDTQMSEIM